MPKYPRRRQPERPPRKAASATDYVRPERPRRRVTSEIAKAKLADQFLDHPPHPAMRRVFGVPRMPVKADVGHRDRDRRPKNRQPQRLAHNVCKLQWKRRRHAAARDRQGDRLEMWQRQRHAAGQSLSLQRRALNPASLRAMLWRYPVMTAKVCAAIYWQALRLWFKGIPFYSHPTSTARAANE